jgi:hypothetical protein
MPETPFTLPPAPQQPVRPFADFRELGLLWLVNRVVFHPRGYALALAYNDGVCTGWELLGDGSEPWRYADEVDEDNAHAAVEALLADLRANPTPTPTAEGHQ